MSLLKWIRSRQHLQDHLSLLLNGVCFIRLQVAFVFPTLPPFCFSSRTKISSSSIHFIDGKFLHSFPSMFLSGDSHEDSNGASSSSFLIPFSSPVDSSQDLSIISPFSRLKYLLLTVLLIFIHFPLFNCSGVLKISRRFVFPLYFRSSSFEDVPSFKPFNSTGAISHLNRSIVFSFEWALTHRSFPRILPDSSIFQELS